jgi:hypothetical protein
MCSLAHALEFLAVLAKRTATSIGGDTANLIAAAYVEGGYLADDGAMRALACVKTTEDLDAVEQAVRCVYLPWLEDTAGHFQERISINSLPAIAAQETIIATDGDCVLFADGLRFDVGQRLAAAARGRQLEVSVAWRWAGLPTVTATAKPAVSPVAGKVRGRQLEGDFCPETDSGEKLNIDRFRSLLSSQGFQVLGPAEVGDPQAAHALGWSECGEIDKLGHDLQAKLAAQIEDQLDLLLERVQGLLNAGWMRVRLVTDHGWLLVPGGMSKVQLPKYLTESRWSRCATIKDGSHIEVPIAGWSWNLQQKFAYAPGVHCFTAGQEYAHGGASVQECLIPVVTFVSTEPPVLTVTFRETRWVGLRCRVVVDPPVAHLRVDLRTKPNVADTSIAEPKKIDAEGKAALLVEDESLKGTVASLVIVDGSGRVVRKEATTVGGEE